MLDMEQAARVFDWERGIQHMIDGTTQEAWMAWLDGPDVNATWMAEDGTVTWDGLGSALAFARGKVNVVINTRGGSVSAALADNSGRVYHCRFDAIKEIPNAVVSAILRAMEGA